MLFPRRNHPLREHSARTGAHTRRARTLAGSLLVGLTAALAACQPAQDAEEPAAAAGPEVSVTSAFDAPQAAGAALALAFIPDSEAPWNGFVVAAALGGGLDLYDAEGAVRSTLAGPRLSGLAAAPGFALRGQALPLVFSADPEAGVVRAYVLIRDEAVLLEAPVSEIRPDDGAASVCLLHEGPGYVDIAVLGRGARLEIWRVMDTGGDVLSAQMRRAFALPVAARACAADNGDLILSSPGAGLLRVTGDGQRLAVSAANAPHIAVGDFAGRTLLLATDAASGAISAYYARDLAYIGDVRVVDGFSTPGLERAGTIAVTPSSFGGTGYSAGLVAVVDETDGRVRIIVRDVFARAFIPDS